MKFLKTLAVLLLVTLGSSQATPYDSCRKAGEGAYFLMTWSMTVPGALPAPLESQIQSAVERFCEAGCLGFCSAKVKLPLTPQQLALRENCRKTGYDEDCSPFLDSIGAPKEQREKERPACFFAGGASCYNEPYGLHDSATYASAKLACLTGVPAACVYFQNSIQKHFERNRESRCQGKGAKSCPPTKEELIYLKKGNFPPAPACAEKSPADLTALENKVALLFEVECKKGAVDVKMLSSEKLAGGYPCGKIRIEGDACSAGWKAGYGCACANAAKLPIPHYWFECENGKQGFRCRRMQRAEIVTTLTAKSVPAEARECLKTAAREPRDAREEHSPAVRCLINAVAAKLSLAGCQFLKMAVANSSSPADECYANLAQREKNAAQCEPIEAAVTYNQCLRRVAYEKKEGTLCEKMIHPSSDDKMACASIKTSFGGKDFCAGLEKDQDHCYAHAARSSKNAALCEKIKLTETNNPDANANQISCYNDLVYELKDAKICHGIADRKVREACYSQYGSQPVAAEKCREIPTDFSTERANCLLNGSFCEDIDPNATDLKAFGRNIKAFCLELKRGR